MTNRNEMRTSIGPESNDGQPLATEKSFRGDTYTVLPVDAAGSILLQGYLRLIPFLPEAMLRLMHNTEILHSGEQVLLVYTLNCGFEAEVVFRVKSTGNCLEEADTPLMHESRTNRADLEATVQELREEGVNSKRVVHLNSTEFLASMMSSFSIDADSVQISPTAEPTGPGSESFPAVGSPEHNLLREIFRLEHGEYPHDEDEGQEDDEHRTVY